MGETQYHKGCCMELGNWPIKVQLGSTNSKGLPVLFQGSTRVYALNNQSIHYDGCRGHAHGPFCTSTQSSPCPVRCHPSIIKPSCLQSVEPPPTPMPLSARSANVATILIHTVIQHQRTQFSPPQAQGQIVILTPKELNQLRQADHPAGGPPC